jgi:hypothetical protein
MRNIPRPGRMDEEAPRCNGVSEGYKGHRIFPQEAGKNIADAIRQQRRGEGNRVIFMIKSIPYFV